MGRASEQTLAVSKVKVVALEVTARQNIRIISSLAIDSLRASAESGCPRLTIQAIDLTRISLRQRGVIDCLNTHVRLGISQYA